MDSIIYIVKVKLLIVIDNSITKNSLDRTSQTSQDIGENKNNFSNSFLSEEYIQNGKKLEQSQKKEKDIKITINSDLEHKKIIRLLLIKFSQTPFHFAFYSNDTSEYFFRYYCEQEIL